MDSVSYEGKVSGDGVRLISKISPSKAGAQLRQRHDTISTSRR